MTKNRYLKDLKRIEFIITNACTGRCKHCSQGEHNHTGEHLDADAAVKALKRVAEKYNILSVMTFGGEGLLYPDTVYKIHFAAYEAGIEKRQLITNGFFSRDKGYITDTVRRLAESRINDLLLSVDVFHEECIPMEYVMTFAEKVMKKHIPIRLNPAWLSSPDADNPYNIRTRQITERFKELGIAEGGGNIIFPEGNALKYFSEYFNDSIPNPYIEDPENLKTISIEPNGTVLGENILNKDILDILTDYKPNNTAKNNEINIHPYNGWYFIFGQSPTRYWRRTSAL